MFETSVAKHFSVRRKMVEQKSLFFPWGKYILVTLVIPKVGSTEGLWNIFGVVPWRAEAVSEGNFLLQYSA